ncbi:PD-(D/E)XK nuclease family protein, partial [Stutzerimonas stutzeri]|uniref:PD-(D/E)XK nuclease family protein n=1 Tax=Stutzerimonas stutzeri TaxID=316 RepID=UPI0024B68A25
MHTEYRAIVDAFLESGISATALNSYLSDPWECFFKNILRLPETKAPHQMYGTAIHAALERMYD